MSVPLPSQVKTGSVTLASLVEGANKKKNDGVTGLLGNLVGDVKNAAWGLPTGVINAIEHPIRAGEGIIHASWEMYSPLIHGQFGKFAHNVYDHPLAPLLDIATVFSLGATGSIKAASLLSKEGLIADSGRIAKLAKFNEPKSFALRDARTDAGGHRPTRDVHFGTGAKRLGQELNWKALEKLSPHLPKMVQGAYSKQARYEKLNRMEQAGRHAAYNLWLDTALKAGKAISDPKVAPIALREVLVSRYMNITRHADRIGPTDQILRYSKKGEVRGLHNQDLLFVKDMRFFSGNEEYRKFQTQTGLQARTLDRERQKYAELANEAKNIKKQLDFEKAALKKKLGPDEIQQRSRREQKNLVRRLENRYKKAERAQIAHEDITRRLGDLVAARQLADVKVAQRKNLFAWKPEEFESRATSMRSWALTDDPIKAARDAKGNYLVVSKHNMRALDQEAGGSITFLRKFWQAPHRVWKTAQIGYTPRTITQNGIGNYSIYAMRQGGDGALVSLVRSVHSLKGNREAAKLAAVGIGKDSHAWIYKEFGDQIGNTFGHELKAEGIRQGKVAKKLEKGLYPVVQRYADDPIRLASIYAAIRKEPLVKKHMKAGLSLERAYRKALKSDTGIRDRAAWNSVVTAGDYLTKNPIERVVSNIVPFYLWDRHILRSVGHTVVETPGRVAMATRVGQQGTEETAKLLGALPEFLHGAVPGALLPGLSSVKNGRAQIFQTAYLNPFAQIGDLAGLGEAVATGRGVNPGAAIAQQVSPFITGTGQFIFQKNLSTGANIPRVAGFENGLPGSVLKQISGGLPELRLFKALTTPESTTSPKTGNDYLYKHDKQSVITSIFGVPVRDVSLDTAEKLASGEETTLLKQAGWKAPSRKKKTLADLVPPL